MLRWAPVLAITTVIAVACSTYGAQEDATVAPPRDGGGGSGEEDATAADACVDCPAIDVPAGWSLVVLATSTCPTSFPEVHEYVANPSAPADTCTCSCGAPIENGCTKGAATVSIRTGASTCNDAMFSADCDGACHALTIVASMWAGASMPARPPVQIACAETSVPPALVDDGAVKVCRSSVAGSVPPIGTAACVMRSGDEACPASWPSRKLLVSAAEIIDSRKCATCACKATPSSCGLPTLTFYSDAACAGAGAGIAANNVCNAFVSGGVPTHYRYTAQANGATCAPTTTSVAVQGVVQLGARETMCCR